MPAQSLHAKILENVNTVGMAHKEDRITTLYCNWNSLEKVSDFKHIHSSDLYLSADIWGDEAAIKRAQSVSEVVLASSCCSTVGRYWIVLGFVYVFHTIQWFRGARELSKSTRKLWACDCFVQCVFEYEGRIACWKRSVDAAEARKAYAVSVSIRALLIPRLHRRSAN